jgi:general stress protein 26
MTEGAQKVNELIDGIRFAMLTTVDDLGKLVARPLTVQEREFDGDLWFLATRDSTAVTQLGVNPGAGVTLTSGDTWVSLSGTAEMVDDKAKVKKFWNPFVEAWFPEGPDDPNIVLLKFSSDSAEYWDSPGGRIASAISLVKAKVTGEQYDGGENGKVEL